MSWQLNYQFSAREMNFWTLFFSPRLAFRFNNRNTNRRINSAVFITVWRKRCSRRDKNAPATRQAGRRGIPRTVPKEVDEDGFTSIYTGPPAAEELWCRIYRGRTNTIKRNSAT